MRFIYDLLSGCLVVMSTTGLLTERIKGWQYIALTMYVMAMDELSKITGLGQVIGLVMVPVLFVLLAFCIKNKRIWNLCLGCVGYLISIALNNLVLYMVSKFGKISVYTISEKYWLLFSIGYIAFIAMLIFFIRRCLIDKKKESIEKMTQTMTIPVFFRVSARVGQATFFSSAFSSRKNRPTRLKKPGFLSLSDLALAFSALAGLVSFAFSSVPSWFIFSFSDIQFHPSFLQGMWAIIT